MQTEQLDQDIVSRLTLLASWVDNDERAPPELGVFALAAAEIERLRDQIARIRDLAGS